MSNVPQNPDNDATPLEAELLAEPAPLIEPEPEAVLIAETLVIAEPVVVAEPLVEIDYEASADDAVSSSETERISPEPAVDTIIAPAAVQTVYVTAPVPPKKKSNRGVGVLIAVAGLVVFAAVFAGIIAIVMSVLFGADAVGSLFGSFLTSSAFLAPVTVFFVVFVLAVLLINRAGWWAWVIGSLVIGVIVYFASIGVILLVGNVIGMTPDEAAIAFSQLAVSAPVIVAALLAREVTIWFGLLIAARGRKVKARNIEARAAFDREQAETRASYAS